MAQNTTPVVGQSCTVSSGPNKGKKGKYTRDEYGKLWCEGDWGGTECTGSKCTSAKPSLSIFEYVAGDGALVNAVEGVVEANGDVFQISVVMEAASGKVRSISTVPIIGVPLSELDGSEVEQRAAKALEGQFQRKGKAS